MRILVAGATGVIGRQLVPRLVRNGHEVIGMTRESGKRALLESMGAVPLVADALDKVQVTDAVAQSRPEAIIHQLTAIGSVNTRRMRRDFAMTNRLRTIGTDHLLAAAKAARVERLVAQSHVAIYDRTGGGLRRETDPLDSSSPYQMRPNQDALKHLENAVLGARWTEAIVLRYGWFYGPGTTLAPNGDSFEMIRSRKFPLVGDGGAIWSFVHVGDAAEATIAALERGRPGIYNIVDDDPAPVSEWLPEVARRLAAKPPLRIPRFIGRMFAGEAGIVLMTELRGASNEKAKRDLGWRPEHPTWREAMVMRTD